MKFLKKKQNRVLTFLLPALVVFILAGGLFYFKTNHISNYSNRFNQINLNNFNLEYFVSQVTAPSSYYATDDNMLTAYDSQGGMAPPRLILSKGQQIIDNYYQKITEELKNDCIVIWSTRSFESVDDWNKSVTQFEGNLLNPEQISVGSRQASVYTLHMTSKDIYVGYLPIGNKENTSYYFHTCNTNNKSDFESVIKSIKFLSDQPSSF